MKNNRRVFHLRQYVTMIILLVSFLILSALTTWAWDPCPSCNPACTSCQTCNCGTCVNKCNSCQTCVGGSCQPKCNSCQTCVNGSCQPKCSSSQCQTCVNGNCQSTCNSCQTCVNGECKPKPEITYTYDAVGNRISMTGPGCATTTYTYDYLNRLTSVTDPDGVVITYDYDPNGNRTEMVTSEGTTTYTYDDNNQLVSVENTMDEGRWTQYEYDSLGNQTRVDEPNGTYTEYTYDPDRNWLTSVINRQSDGTIISAYYYNDYDNVGNRLNVTEFDGSVVSYGYNDIYELESEARTGSNAYSISYAYDDVGNRLQKTENRGQITETTYTYNANNQLTTETIDSDTILTYSYDLNGNLLEKGDGSDTTLYTWDYDNRLSTVNSTLVTVNYSYDADGNRLSKTRQTDGGQAVTTKYINDVASPLVQVVMETNEYGEAQARYTYGNDLISRVTSYPSPVTSYYHYDGLGSTRQLTDDTQTVVAEYTYDAFGNVIAQTTGGGMAHNPATEQNSPINKVGAGLLASLILGFGIVTAKCRPVRRLGGPARHLFGGRKGILLILILSMALIMVSIPTSTATEADVTGNPYGFTGESQFGEADDLIFLRARYYSPSTGRFISRDPINIAGGINLYGYCRNNPVNDVDPSGELSIIVIVGVVIIVGAILTINCLLKISKFQNKVKELEKENSDECSTNDAWNRATDTQEYKDMISACGMPSPGA